MKKIITFLLLGFATSFFAQHYNLKKGYVAEGYDVVSYFKNTEPLEGHKKFETTFNGVKFKFANKENLEAFKKEPAKYIPAYGGYCAYAVGAKSEKVGVNPKTFEIRDGKLYLFYNSWGINTLKMWQKEGAEDLQLKADKNWKIINKK